MSVEWVNITAKSLPEAIDLALDNLGVDESEAEIEVLEEPRQGLFGRMRGNARVRARVKPKGTRPKVERGRTRRRRDGGDEGGGGTTTTTREGRSSSGGAGSSGSRSRSRNGGASGGSGGARRSEAGGGSDAAVAVADEAAGSEGRADTAAAPARGGRSGGGRSRGEAGGSANGRSAGQDREPAEEASVEEVSSQLRDFLSGLTRAFGYDSPVEIRSDDEDGLIGSVEGRHGLMVGPRGRTLDAIQELARVSVQRSAPSNIRMKVDVGGYREIRREALRTFALEAAAAVRLDGRERLLEPMSSADRKVVHDTLSLEDGIETRSAGAEPNRRVVVLAVGGPALAAVADDDEGPAAAHAEEAVSTNGDGAVHSDPQAVDEPVGDAEETEAAEAGAGAGDEAAVAAVAEGEAEDGSGD